MTFAICFDFPETPGQPLFAGWLYDGGLGFAPRLETAARFDTWEAAERTLENSYGRETRTFGTVVELDQ